MNFRNLVLCLSGGAALSWAFLSQGVEFYVARSGDDSNLGTKTKPFATFEQAREAASRVAQIFNLLYRRL